YSYAHVRIIRTLSSHNSLDDDRCRMRSKSRGTHGNPLPTTLFIQAPAHGGETHPPQGVLAEVASAASGRQYSRSIEGNILDVFQNARLRSAQRGDATQRSSSRTHARLTLAVPRGRRDASHQSFPQSR